ncbi:MAG: M4 family metallopeptidase [Polyangiales bacterium]
MFEVVRRARAHTRSRTGAWSFSLLLAGLMLLACDDAPSTSSSLERVRRAPDVVGKGLQQGLALGGVKPRLRSVPLDDDAALRGVVDLAWTTKAQPVEGVRRGLLALVRASTEPPRVTLDEDTRGSVAFQGAVPNPYGADADAAETMVRRWFAELSLAPGRGLVLRKRGSARGEAGDLHMMFDVAMPAPSHDPALALPVWNVALHAHFAADATLTSLHGTGLLGVDPPDEARLDDEAAQRAALRAHAGDGAPQRTLGTPVLGVWRGLSETSEGARAYRVEHTHGHEVFATFVDARTGAVLATHPLSHSDAPTAPVLGSATDYRNVTIPVRATYTPSSSLFTLLDQSQPQRGRIYTYDADNVEVFTSTPELMSSSALNAWDVAGATAHHHVRLTLDYLWNAHQRNSWDDRGGDMHVLVHVGERLMNAYFVAAGGSASLRFGDGIAGQIYDTAGCLDIVAHELGHGVVATSVPLVYQGMPGALNESFADVFGTLVDDANWTLAERCVGSGSNSYLRSMEFPERRWQPAHMLDYRRMSNDLAGDYGGVHVNSGIPNRAAFLLATARGRPVLGKVWYQTLKSMHIEPNASFNHMALGTLGACEDLRAAGVLSRADCDAVAAAWSDVGVSVLENASVGACPAHARAQSGVCVCDEDRTPSEDGTTCLALADLVCPSNSRVVDGECECAIGYRNVNGVCTDDPSACPANSAYDAALARCACSEGFEGDPFATAGCVVMSSTCPSKAHPEWEGSRLEDPTGYTCVCNAGFEFDPAAGDCAARPGSCGEETFRGRCDGAQLTYCTSAGKRASVDCGASGFACGLVDVLHGYDCLNPTGLPVASACNPSASQECDADNPLCISRRGETAGFCSLACDTGDDCPQPFACCAPIGDGTRACLLETYCATARDARSVCDDVPGSTAYGTCLPGARVSYCDPATRRTVEADCGARGQICGLESAEAGYACVDDASAKSAGDDACATQDDGVCDVPAGCPEGTDLRDCHPCGAVTAQGRCTGTSLEVCDATLGLVTTECATGTQGLACEVVGGVAACRAPAVPAPTVMTSPVPAGCAAYGTHAADPRAGALWLLALVALVRRRARRLVQ